jgi:hypothetical protein
MRWEIIADSAKFGLRLVFGESNPSQCYPQLTCHDFQSGKGKDMIRHSTKRWPRMALISAVLLLGSTMQARAFFPPDPVPVPHIIVIPDVPPGPPAPPPGCVPPPPCDPFTPHHNVVPHMCGCNPGPHINRTPEPVTIVSSLIGLSIMGGIGLRRRLMKK